MADMNRIRHEDAPDDRAWRTDRIYAHIAQALARGYTDLYYVNMETDALIEYHTDDARGVLTEARRSRDFFEGCERDARLYVHPEDQEAFIRAMRRDFLTRALDRSGLFEMTYRRIKDGRSFYVRMKVSRMEDDKRIIVIAVSDIDELMKQRQAEERIQEERIIYARLHALTGNFIVVYVVDPETGRYREFSATDNFVESFAQAKEGEDFFAKAREEARSYNHPEDVERFLSAFTRENILSEIRARGIFTIVYRIMMDGRPTYVQLNAAMVEEKEGPRLIVGLNDIDAQYRQKEKGDEIARQREIFNQITEKLAQQYDVLYYIDIETCAYAVISATDEYRALNLPTRGTDFFADGRRNVGRYVHPGDRDMVSRLHHRDVMLDHLKDRGDYSTTFRLTVQGRIRHVRHTEIMARDGKHIIVCVKNIDAEIEAEHALMADRQKSATYTQIAEGLASHFDLIYYVDCKTSHYAELATGTRSGELQVQRKGNDFFAACRKNIDRLIFSEDRDRIRLFLDRDNLITQLEGRRQLTEDYRMNIGGGKTQYTRMLVTYASDQSHFIVCVENRDEYVRREKEHLAALSMANEMARRDALTHTKNKTAYHEMEEALQKQIEEGGGPFGIVVCDINGLKAINDTEGHKAGDEYIKTSCMLVCRTFQHSPVFRIGGDEFAVILRGQDFANREQLLAGMRRKVEENVRTGEGSVVASGLAEFQPVIDRTVEDVFNRADSRMYENKTRLKEQKSLQECHSLKEKLTDRPISEERRLMLDTLFKAFEVVSERTYVFLCDMKHDFSRWSKNAVDTFGLPSEYMYAAGDIWEERIHPEDRAAYHRSIDEIFAGNAAGHDMQYRARRPSGEYDVCTCRGVVMRDASGEPEFFAGTIRNHGIQGHIDTLTGLRNQYGFFEDLDGSIRRNAVISVLLFGISRFSEINEMYGYHFGNRVLQQYARKVFEGTGNAGHTYRIDGTKFAIISNTLTIPEMQMGYNRFRAFLHEDFRVDGRKVLLDLHCGAVRVDSFDIDSQTIYACLNYADEESKLRHQGEMVAFRNDLNGESQQRLEKLHEIRASIMQEQEGFFLLYQPVVDARTERLIGAEALLRWKSDRYSVVSPDEFIPILETDPLFPELGEWILREAVTAARQMLALNPDLVINVNLSYTQVEKPGFVDMVLRILDSVGFPPEHLCLELTERCRLLDMALLKNVVVELRSRGILVALDDFGTGFSSISILKEIPVNVIKIDRSYVRMIEENEVDRKIVGSIADLASFFGAKVCVEGIETAGMRDILLKYQVESFQGYYYAKPLPLEQLRTWESDRRRAKQQPGTAECQ